MQVFGLMCEATKNKIESGSKGKYRDNYVLQVFFLHIDSSFGQCPKLGRFSTWRPSLLKLERSYFVWIISWPLGWDLTPWMFCWVTKSVMSQSSADTKPGWWSPHQVWCQRWGRDPLLVLGVTAAECLTFSCCLSHRQQHAVWITMITIMVGGDSSRRRSKNRSKKGAWAGMPGILLSCLLTKWKQAAATTLHNCTKVRNTQCLFIIS